MGGQGGVGWGGVGWGGGTGWGGGWRVDASASIDNLELVHSK